MQRAGGGAGGLASGDRWRSRASLLGGSEGWGSRQGFPPPAPCGCDAAPHRQGGSGGVVGRGRGCDRGRGSDFVALPALRHADSRPTRGCGRYSVALPGRAKKPAKTPLFTPVSGRPGTPRPLAGGPAYGRAASGAESSGTLGCGCWSVFASANSFSINKCQDSY